MLEPGVARSSVSLEPLTGDKATLRAR
jgi:hypothetical protein